MTRADLPDMPAIRSDLRDVDKFVRDFGSPAGEPANLRVVSTCAVCGGQRFWMECSEEDGVARRTCTGCKDVAFIGDSQELWDEADTGDATCPCGRKVFAIVVGYCTDAVGEVNWMIVGAKCEECSEIGVYADWSIDFEPSAFLLERS